MSTPFCPEIVNNLLTIHFSRRKNGGNKTCRPSDEARAAGCRLLPIQLTANSKENFA